MNPKLDNNPIPEFGFLRLPDVLKIIPVSRSSWWAGVQEGKYPKGIKLGPRTTAWRVEDIRNLVREINTSNSTNSPSEGR